MSIPFERGRDQVSFKLIHYRNAWVPRPCTKPAPPVRRACAVAPQPGCMDRILPRLSALSIALASAMLALEPLGWLARSWRDPAYQSGGWFAAAMLGAALASVRSGTASGDRRANGLLAVFALAAALRPLGQVLAVNILSTLALAVDVFALARLLRLDLRPLALSPVWLAAFFLFALPLAPILERVLGFPLQMASARIACALLTPAFDALACEGVRLRVNGADVLVALPCAGASGLLAMLALWTGLNVRLRPAPLAAAWGLALVLVAALLGNGVRIALLAAGLGAGIDTMAPALHEGIGLLALAAAAGAAPERSPDAGARAGRVLAERGGRQIELPLLWSTYAVNIEGDMATVEVIQVFENPSDVPLEAEYLFPLDHRAAVYGMEMRVGDETLRAVIREKETAEAAFVAAQDAGKAAALRPKHRPNMFTQRIANLMPGLRVEVRLRYVQDVPMIDGLYQLTVPMVVGPRYEGAGPDPLDVAAPDSVALGAWAVAPLPAYPRWAGSICRTPAPPGVSHSTCPSPRVCR